MKRRLFRATTAALLAVAVVVPTSAPAANAAVSPITVITVLKGAYDTISKFFAGGLSTQQAVDQIKTAIAQAQTQIIDEIDLVAAANVQACAQSAVINYADIDAFTPDTLQSYALATTDCVTQADSLLSALTDKAAIDNVGFALHTVAPLAVVGRAKAGLGTSALRATIVNASNTDIGKLAPACYDSFFTDDGGVETETYECDAYDGTVATARKVVRNGQGKILPGQVNYIGIQDQATANTSRVLSQTAVARPITGYGGKCVDVAGAATAAGTQIQLYTCNGTGAQQWTIEPDRTIRALGMCMAPAAGTADGTRVQLFACTGNPGTEVWQISGTQLIDTNSGKCLDATGVSSADGTPLQLWGCTGGANQQWTT